MADGTDEESAYAARMDGWILWEVRDARDGIVQRGDGSVVTAIILIFSFSFSIIRGYSCPRDLRTAHLWRATDSLSCSCPADGRPLALFS
jgi:hypothetical protein